MRISRDELSSIVSRAPRLWGQKPARANVNRLAGQLRSRLRRDIDRYMQPWMLLLDEAVRFFVYLERYQYSLELSSDTSPFALQLSRLRSDVLSVRELISIGQEAPAHTVARSFVDGVELAMALAEDPSFAIAYSEAEDETVFWKKHIGYGRIYRSVERFIRRTGGSERHATDHIARHKEIKNILSGHVHIAPHSAFRAGAVPSLSRPGMFQIGEIGGLSIHMPQLCLLVANETHIFAACCIKAFIRPNPPPVFSNYRPSKKLHDTITSAHVLQELLDRHLDRLQQLSDSFFRHDSNENAT